MSDVLSTPTIKSGNVLALLNTLYTSGFASASPSTPMLNGMFVFLCKNYDPRRKFTTTSCPPVRTKYAFPVL